MKKVKATVCNVEGLHMRPAMFITDMASKYKKCNITISTPDSEANAKSIMQVMLVYAPKGTEMIITADGEGEEEVAERIQKLINGGFPEIDFRKSEELKNSC